MNEIRIESAAPKAALSLGEKFAGVSRSGHTLHMTNESMVLDGENRFVVCGEAHFSRISPDQWEDTILKMKMGGVDVAATYVFWNVHEEVEGVFRFDGCRDLRRFLEICKQHDMMVILRVGPFDHGEMRNGGLPDWLYGKPFDVRNNSEGYLACVRRLYHAIHTQTEGLYFKDDGPIIGIQIENEYMHSSANWEITTGISNEWINGGHDGDAHMLALKKIAMEEGLIAPFYTCTAWGGARTPVDEMLPLWGGYSYRPWIFYNHKGEHPCTPEYIYRDNHNNAVPATYNFEPRYAPESMPYACCEMMGGMMCSYDYRFTLPFESVDALANIKLGSGCSMLGYYMYRGGTNPIGEKTPFLNESHICKRSYDYQAVLGEFGQVRPSWARLRTLHDLCHSFPDTLIGAKTYLPKGTDDQQPEDKDTLRWCVRTDGRRGFMFVNNFQDHLDMPAKIGESITVHLPDEDIAFDPFGIAGGENAVLPFNLDMDGHLLKTATAQPITRLVIEDRPCWFFMAPEGMQPVFRFADGQTITPEPDTCFLLGEVKVYVFCRRMAMNFAHLRVNGQDVALLTDAVPIWDGQTLRLEHQGQPVHLMTLPPIAFEAMKETKTAPAAWEGFAGFDLIPAAAVPVSLLPKQVRQNRYTLNIPTSALKGHKTVLLRVKYLADIGQAFINGEMISDNFCNGQPWDIRLDCYADALEKHPLTLYLVPIREGVTMNADNAMAGQMELVQGETAHLDSLELVYVDEMTIALSKNE